MFEKIDSLKKKIDSYRPLQQEIAQQLRQYFRIGLTYTSNALEGNSLTETETKVVLEDGLTVAGKPMRDYYEALGHSDAYSYMLELCKDTTITLEHILHIHKLFYTKIDTENAGMYRKVPVVISGSDTKFPRPDELESKMKQFEASIPELEKKLHSVEFAARIHLDFIMIHPFIDGNGRTARLLLNLALLQHSYVITIIPPARRVEYIRSLQLVSSDRGRAFIDFITDCVHESHKEYLRLLEGLVAV